MSSISDTSAELQHSVVIEHFLTKPHKDILNGPAGGHLLQGNCFFNQTVSLKYYKKKRISTMHIMLYHVFAYIVKMIKRW